MTYNGSAQTATVACLGGGDGDAGQRRHRHQCRLVSGDGRLCGEHELAAATDFQQGHFVINPATQTASITNSPVTYNGSAQTATVACLGGGTATLASGGTGTDVGSYPATVDCAASTNYCGNGLGLRRPLRHRPGHADGVDHQQSGDLQRLGADGNGGLPGRRHGDAGQRRHRHQCRLVSGDGGLCGEHELLRRATGLNAATSSSTRPCRRRRSPTVR